MSVILSTAWDKGGKAQTFFLISTDTRIPQSGPSKRAIALRSYSVTVLSKGRMPTAITHNARSVLPVNIFIYTSHPRTNFIHQQILAQTQHIIGPLLHPLICCSELRQAVYSSILNELRYPLNAVFSGSSIVS